MFKTIRARIVWTFSVLVVLNLPQLLVDLQFLRDCHQRHHDHPRQLPERAGRGEYDEISGASGQCAPGGERRRARHSADGSLTENRDLFLNWTENRDLFYYWYDQAIRSVALPEQEPLRDSIQSSYRQYTLLGDSMSARIKQGAFEGAKEYYYHRIRPVSDQLRDLCFRLFEINQNGLYNAMPQTHSIANKTAYVTMLASIVSLVLSIIATSWLIRSFVTPAEQLTERVKQIGAGKHRSEDRRALGRRDRTAQPGVQQDDRTAPAVRRDEHRQDAFGEAEVGADRRQHHRRPDHDRRILRSSSHCNRRVADLFGFDEACSDRRNPWLHVVHDAGYCGSSGTRWRARRRPQDQTVVLSSNLSGKARPLLPAEAHHAARPRRTTVRRPRAVAGYHAVQGTRPDEIGVHCHGVPRVPDAGDIDQYERGYSGSGDTRTADANGRRSWSRRRRRTVTG